MSIPDSRNRTYAANQRVARADVLWQEDMLVASYRRRRRGVRVLRLSPFMSEPDRMSWPTAFADLDFPLRLQVGLRVHQVSANVFRDSAALTLALRRSPVAAPTMVDIASAAGGSAGIWADLPLTFAYPYHAIEPGYTYVIRLTRGASGDDLSGLEITVDIP